LLDNAARGFTEILQEQEPETVWQIDPEQYDIQGFEKYDKPLLVQIVRLHHEK
jgi:hypothetical protein